MSQQLEFKPHARLLTMLGDQLIKNERIALVEIIKNSYDADASWVKVSFEDFGPGYKVTPLSRIVIEDDGTGITKNILEHHWISPATPVKKLAKANNDTTPRGRKIQGEKGIGRFAILKLGKTISILTRPQGSATEYTLALDLSHYDDDFLTEDGKSADLPLSKIKLQLSESQSPAYIKAESIELGARIIKRAPHGTRIEVSHLRGTWSENKVKDVYQDLIRLQSIFSDIEAHEPSKQSDRSFDVVIYKDKNPESLSDEYLTHLQTLIQQNAVLRITDGVFDQDKNAFRFKLNGKLTVIPLSDPDLSGLSVFRAAFGKKGEVLQERSIKCGSFSFGFYVFDFGKDAKGKYQVDQEDRKLIKAHRIYLYRDGVRVYPYGDPEDDWLQTDTYRGTKQAGMFLSNDQMVGFVNITQRENPELQDKTNREGLIDVGDATNDFRNLLQIFLAWVRAKPYKKYKIAQQEKTDVGIVKQEQVKKELTDLQERFSGDKSAQAALKHVTNLYLTERSFLIKRAETTENLAGVGLSVETASHDIMAVMRRALVALDALISETEKAGQLSKEFFNREIISLRGMLSFIETQLKDIQLLFKSSKQRRKDVRIKDVLLKVEKLFARTLSKEGIDFQVRDSGSPLIAKTTDAVLLQLFLNLLDNSIYWLRSKAPSKRQIEVLLDGDEGHMIFADNGPGIKQEDAPYLFEPFFSGRGEDGRGLGLYIARQLLQRHDYSIELVGPKRQKILPGANFLSLL
jgi:signal transduction histidine kinase